MDQVEEVKSKTDIVSIIGEYVDLKKAGRNFKGLCPFHSEKTPSFMVSPELQIFKCFGCSESGDVFTFLEKHEGMDFSESLRVLAKRAGVKLKPINTKGREEREVLYEINNLASRYYQYMLLKHALGKRALAYLRKERGLSAESIKMFKIGYSPPQSTSLKKYLVGKKKIKEEDIEKAGLSYKGRYGFTDRFSGRVIFPLFDHRGNPIGFAGRLLPGDSRDVGKYINTPETPVYHKSSTLYGLNKTRAEIKKKGYAVVVEGELDLISSWQAGIKNTVAAKGTALTEGQVRLISRFAKEITLALDADIAGNEAALRGIEIAQKQGLDVKVAVLAKYKDPDDAARKDPKYYKKVLKDAKDVWEFIIDFTVSKVDTKTGQGKAKASRQLTPILAKIEDDIVQAHYIKYLAEKLEVPINSVSDEVKKEDTPASTGKVETKPSIDKRVAKKTRRQILEETLLTLFFQTEHPKVKELPLALIKTPLAKKITDELASFQKGKFDMAVFTKKLPKELIDGFGAITMSGEDFSEDIEELEEEKKLVIKELYKLEIKERRTLLVEKIKNFEKEGETKKAKAMSRKFDELGEKLSLLEREETSGIIL